MTKRTRAAAATLAAAVSAVAAESPLRVAVVGAGSIGREFSLHHFGSQTGTTVTAVVDANLPAARRLAEDVGSVQAGASVGGPHKYKAAVSGPPRGEPVAASASLDASVLDTCDIVYIGTPPSSHRALVTAALAADKHVLLEKPVAASAEDADAIVAAADEAAARGVRLGMNVGMRWNRALIEMRRLAIDEGAIGTLAGGHLSLHFVRWPREWQTVEWCAGRAQGGPLREVGTHQLFALCELFGCGTRVRATVTYPDGATGTAAEASVEGIVEMAGGLQIELSIRTDGGGLASDGRDHYELGLRGERGALLLDAFTSLRRTAPLWRRGTLVRSSDYGRKESVETLVRAVRGTHGVGEELAPRVTARDGRNAQRLVDAILASDGAWVEVPRDEREAQE